MDEAHGIGAILGTGDATTFLGLPKATPETARGCAAVLGADTATPYAGPGAYCAGAPRALRAAVAGYATEAPHHDFDLDGPVLPPGVQAVDCGDVAVGDDHARNRERIRAACGAMLDRGAAPILLGGDDSVPLPLIAALAARGPLTILQIDAHIDWRDEIGGERLGLSSTMRRASEIAGVGPIVQVGQRGLGSARSSDRDDALASGVTLVSARELHREGAGRALAAIPPAARLLVALDVDVLDPSICPAVIAPSAGGLSYWQVVELIAAASARAPIAAMSCVELVPRRDRDGLSALTAARVVVDVLGLLARQP